MVQFRSVQSSHSVVCDSLWPHGLQHARLPCASPTPGACSNSCPLSWWCHLTISSSEDMGILNGIDYMDRCILFQDMNVLLNLELAKKKKVINNSDTDCGFMFPIIRKKKSHLLLTILMSLLWRKWMAEMRIKLLETRFLELFFFFLLIAAAWIPANK